MTEVLVYFLNVLAASILFLFPYRLCKSRLAKQLLLVGMGLWMVYLVAPRLVLFYVPYWLIVYLGHVALVRSANNHKKIFFIFTICLILSPMVVWKIWPDFFVCNFNLFFHHMAWNISTPFGEIDAIKDAVVPIGISFNTFRAADLLIQSYIGLVNPLRVRDVLCYGFFPPVLAVGPIIEYRDFERGIMPASDQRVSEDIAIGGARILFGLFRVYFLAMPLMFSQEAMLNPGSITTPIMAWFYLLCFSVFFYLNFAGYSDIAIGCARLYGFKIMENFSNPYFKPDLQQFWASWHISLTKFAQRNVFVPFGGHRVKTHNIALVLTMLLIALWHNINFSLVVFGILHASAMLISRKHIAKLRKIQSNKFGYVVCAILTWLFVSLTFPLVLHSIPDALSFYVKLFV